MGGSGRGPLSAAVLAGGLSRRMGTDKALLRLREGDPPLAAVVVEGVRRVAAEVFLVGTERPGYARFGVPVVPDRYPEAGALGGIATALATATNEHCLVVACDLPFLNASLLRWMADQPRDYDVLVPRLPGESRQGTGQVFHTLHAVYGRACLPAIERQLAAGRKQVIGFFADVRVREVGAPIVEQFDPERWSFFNANTPEAAGQASRRLDELDRRAGAG